MIQQETRLKVADNTGAKDMQALAIQSLLLLKMQHQAALLKKVTL